MTEILILYALIVGMAALSGRSNTGHSLPVLVFLLIACVTVFGAKLITLGGVATNIGNIFYAGVMFSMSVKFCRFGRDAALATMRIVFIGLAAITVFRQAVLFFPIVPGDEVLHAAMQRLFSQSLSLITGSFLAFYLAQSLNIYLLGRLRHLGWVRKILANTAAQAVDSVVFFPIAFGAVWTHSQIASAMLAGFVLKASLNLLDTPVWLWLCRHQAVPDKLATLNTPTL